MPNPVPVIEISNLHKAYGQLEVLKGVHVTAHRGDVVSLIGSSGSGKSTLGRALLRLLKSQGQISFDGVDIMPLDKSGMRPLRSRMQVVFQDPLASLDPRMTIGASIEEPMLIFRKSMKKKARTEAVREMMKRVGLDPNMINRYPHELSGGQNQRVGIARAMILKPKLVICDEAVSALDVSIQAQIVELLIKLQQEMDLSMIFISHDLSVVREISHRVMVLYLGRVVEMADRDQIYEDARHPYTQALLSATPEADVTRRDRERIYLGGELPSPANPPSGCRFRTRCPIGPLYRPDRKICSEQDPALATRDGCSKVACHFAAERDALILAEAQNPESAQQR